MALANLNQTYNINPNVIKAYDPSYAYTVAALVNRLMSQAGISQTAKTAIPDSQMASLSRIINAANNANNSIATQLVSLIARYVPEAKRKSFVESNSMRFGTTLLQWNSRTMLYFLYQNQLYLDAAAIIQAKVASRTRYKF